jgi:hypothetical protein
VQRAAVARAGRRIDRIERAADGRLTVSLRRTDGGADLALEVDDVISATGFVTPLLDLPELGVQTVGQSRLPVQTPFWESTTVPGIFFGGTIGQGAKGLQKHGVPANSGAVHGARYNARVLAARIAQTHFGVEPERPHLSPEAIPGFIGAELSEAPELFHQRGYLARVLTADPAGGMRDDGVQPLAHVLDQGGPDALAATLEGDGTGAIYPVIYSRIGGKVVEHAIEPDPLMRFDTIDSRRTILDLVGLTDDYRSDGRVLTEVLDPSAIHEIRSINHSARRHLISMPFAGIGRRRE